LSGMLLQWAGPSVLPATPPPDLAVAPNFERFDGLEQPPLEGPAGNQRIVFYPGGPRPGASAPTPDEYTPGPISGVVGVIGGQPLPTSDRIHRPAGAFTSATAPSIQFRKGVGQHGPSELGVAQTLALSQITNNPPQPGDLTSILAGWG